MAHPFSFRQVANTHTLSVSPFEEPSNRASEAFQAPEHEGWLHKQSDKYKTWNKRWFVLKGTNLFYFKSPKVRKSAWALDLSC